jgi:two-component system sensor histidine kinase QseC
MTNLEFARRQLHGTSRDAQLLESLDDSVLSCDAIRRMVSNLDVLTRSETLSTTLEYHTVEDILATIISTYRCHAALYDMVIRTPTTNSTTRVFVDRRLIRLAIDNLLANAVQHGPRGTTIEVQVDRIDATVIVRIEDDGTPIGADHGDKATSLEAQTQQGRDEHTRYSSGLGLFAAAAAARMAGADLEFTSTDTKNRMSLHIPTTPK